LLRPIASSAGVNRPRAWRQAFQSGGQATLTSPFRISAGCPTSARSRELVAMMIASVSA
jgi:hypothetical protein